MSAGKIAALNAVMELVNTGAGIAFNYQQADKNRKFQERMSSTKHQREVIDLRKAGLNPILSVAGSGGATPSGSTATAPNIGNAVNSALTAKMMSEQIKKIQAEKDKTTTEERILQKNVPLADAQKKILDTSLKPLLSNSAKAVTGYGNGAKGIIPQLIDKTVNTVKSLPKTYETLKNKFNDVINRYKTK